MGRFKVGDLVRIKRDLVGGNDYVEDKTEEEFGVFKKCWRVC